MVPSFKPVAAIVILTGDFFWRRGRFSCWLSDHDVIQHVYGTGPLDTMADVLFWYYRFPCRNPLSERNLKSKETEIFVFMDF